MAPTGLVREAAGARTVGVLGVHLRGGCRSRCRGTWEPRHREPGNYDVPETRAWETQMHRPRRAATALSPSANVVDVPHFCECSAGCEVPTPHGERYCELHPEEPVVLEMIGLVEDDCPRCGLRAPEGSHLHYCDIGGREPNWVVERMSPPRIRRV